MNENLEPLPIDDLVRNVCDDGSDFNDEIGGWASGRYDPVTKTLTLRFERDTDLDPDNEIDVEAYPYDSTVARFKLIIDTESDEVES